MLAGHRYVCLLSALSSVHAQVVRLKRSRLLLPQTYPRFTLLGQAVGSVAVALEALGALVPEVRRVPRGESSVRDAST